MNTAGYLIVENGSGVSNPGLTRSRYLGVDRLPTLIAPDSAIRQALGEPIITNEKLRDALEEWFSLLEATTPLVSSLTKAIHLLNGLKLSGHCFELLFCEMLRGYDDVDSSGVALEEAFDNPLPYIMYGFDVSWPSCKHSAIRQPGVVPGNVKWERRLNKYGLLQTYSDAFLLRREYLQVYPYPPFDIFLVHGVKNANVQKDEGLS